MASICFLDSGVGGLAYVESLFDKHTMNKVYYIADTAYFPYGDKSNDIINERVEQLVLQLLRKHTVDVVVLACNTASVTALEHIRKMVHTPIVGVVPAIKVAVETGVHRVYVMGTNATVNAFYTQDLIEKYAQNTQKFFLRGLPDLVGAVNQMVLCNASAYRDNVAAILGAVADDIMAMDVRAVVLACTHFLYIRDMLVKLLPNTIKVVDSLNGVVERIVSLTSTSLGNANDGNGNTNAAVSTDTGTDTEFAACERVLYTTDDYGVQIFSHYADRNNFVCENIYQAG